MKKYINILIIILDLILMLLLSSCRSPKTMTYNQSLTDSVKLSVKDSTAQRFEFTFDSLVFSNTDYTNHTDEAAVPSGRQSVKSVISVFNKNLPCSRLVIYGGKLTSDKTTLTSQDSIRNKSSTLSKQSVTPCYRSSVIPIVLFGLVLCIFIIYKLYKNRLS